MPTPLDLAAQITLIAFTLRESIDNESEVRGLLEECLALAGLVDVSALDARKEDGLSVFGQLTTYPQGTEADIAALLARITAILGDIPAPAGRPIATPAGRPIATPAGWEMPTTRGVEFSLESTEYVPPYVEPPALPQVTIPEPTVVQLPNEAIAPAPAPVTTPVSPAPAPVTVAVEIPNQPTPSPVPARSAWVNLDPVVSYAVSYPFTNAFKMAGVWISNLISGGWNNGGPLDLDQNGYVRSLQPGRKATIGLFTDTRTYPQGDYVLLWEGNGTFIVDLGSATQVSSTPGRMVVRTIEGKSGIWLSLTAVDPEDYPRNIRFILPGYEATYSTQTFNPAWLERIAPFAGLRFMDWGRTNNSQISSWLGRRTPSYYTQGVTGGVAWEYIIELLNTTGKDGWVCIPHLADTNYVTQMATLFRDTLNPSIKIYLEYSNECWNNLFAQAPYCLAQARALGIPAPNDFQRQMRFYSQRSVECFDIWESVYGDSFSRRVVRVLGAQAAVTASSSYALQWLDAFNKVDAVAIAPYIDPAFYARSSNANIIASSSVDKILDDLRVELRTTLRKRIRAHKVITDRYPRLRLLTYETNTHLVSDKMPAALQTTIVDLYRRVHRDPRMRDLYRELLETIFAETGEFPNHFNFASPINKFGPWGALEYQQQPNSEAPRYQAILDYLDNRDWTPAP